MNTQFTIREKKPTASDPYGKCYIRESSGGWNASIKGKPTDAECDALSNCVGYASGRFSEIYCEITGIPGCHYKYFNGNPVTVPERVKQFYPWLKMDMNPRIGDLIAWTDHVAIVENVISENLLLISDSAYRGDAFRLYTIEKGDGNWGRAQLLCFVHNQAVKDETEEKTDDSKAVEEEPKDDVKEPETGEKEPENGTQIDDSEECEDCIIQYDDEPQKPKWLRTLELILEFFINIFKGENE